MPVVSAVPITRDEFRRTAEAISGFGGTAGEIVSHDNGVRLRAVSVSGGSSRGLVETTQLEADGGPACCAGELNGAVRGVPLADE